MDPISGITGVIGLSKAFIDVISGLKSLRSKYRNAPTALKDIYNECTISQTVLSRVQYILQRHSAALKSTSDARGDLITCFDTAVSETRAVLEDFQCQIEKFRGRNDSKIATGFRARAEIVWKDSYLKETLRRIRDLRANVDFTISSLQFDTVHALHEQVSKTHTLLEALPIRQISTEPTRANHERLHAHLRKKNMTKELREAIERGDIVAVEQLLADGADTNLPLDIMNWYPLHLAAHYGDVTIIQLLYEYDARLNIRTTILNTPLLVAIVAGSTAAALCLIEMGAEVSLANNDGVTPLHWAAEEKNFPVVQHLLVKGADPNAEDKGGITALFCVVSSEDRTGDESNIIKTLLTYGADPTLGTKTTALHQAVASGRNHDLLLMSKVAKSLEATVESLETMVKGYPDVLVSLPEHSGGFTALYLACLLNKLEAMEILIKLGANVDFKAHSALTCLSATVVQGNLDAATLLLKSGADPNIGEPTCPTALRYASRTPERIKFVKLLLKYGANVHSSYNGSVSLHAAVQGGNLDAVETLLEHGADINSTTGNGNTPLMLAARFGNFALLRFLANKGANWRFVCPKGRTALHMACGAGSLLCASFLLGLGDDINKQTLNGLTPLHSAILYSKAEAVAWLLSLGADTSLKLTSAYGLEKAVELGNGTPLDIAKAIGNKRILQSLQENVPGQTRLRWKSTAVDYTAELLQSLPYWQDRTSV